LDDLSDLMDIVPPIDDFDGMDERSRAYISTLDYAIEMAVAAQEGHASFKEAAKEILAWLEISKSFFNDPPLVVKTIHLDRYVEVHNRLLQVALAAGNAEKYRWHP